MAAVNNTTVLPRHGWSVAIEVQGVLLTAKFGTSREMFYKLMICLCAILQIAAQKKENPVANEVVAIKAKCKGIDPSRYGGKNLHLLISITNQQPVAIGFPLAYEQQCGPSIRLVDSRTKAEALFEKPICPTRLSESSSRRSRLENRWCCGG